MVRVLFTETRVVRDGHEGTPQETRFEKGRVYDLVRTSADRWKLRGVAVDAPEDAPAPLATEPPAVDPVVAAGAPHGPAADPPAHTVDIPPGWRDLGWPELKSLAAKLSAEPIKNRPQAFAAVEAEAARRASASGE